MPPRTRRQAQQTIYSVSGLAPGTHTIQIVKTSGTYALLNGFDVTRTINDTDPVIAYNGSWYYNAPSRGLGDYQDDVHATDRERRHRHRQLLRSSISFRRCVLRTGGGRAVSLRIGSTVLISLVSRFLRMAGGGLLTRGLGGVKFRFRKRLRNRRTLVAASSNRPKTAPVMMAAWLAVKLISPLS